MIPCAIYSCMYCNSSITYMFLKWTKDRTMITAVVSIPMTVVDPMMT